MPLVSEVKKKIIAVRKYSAILIKKVQRNTAICRALYQSIIAVENNIFKYQGFDSPIIDYL
jgi:hypothetical protein